MANDIVLETRGLVKKFGDAVILNGIDFTLHAGIGANLSLSSNTDLWLNAKYIFGGYFESSRQINAGVRFSF